MEIPVHLLQRDVPCACGQTHFVPIDHVYVGDDLLLDLPRYLMSQSWVRVLVVADTDTVAAYGDRVLEALREARLDVHSHVFSSDHELLPDEHAIHSVNESMAKCEPQVLIAVGSGVINDVTRYTSFAAGLPYVVVATAPSMDGYASSVAAMQFAGVKTTSPAQTPKAIFADPAVLSAAPWPLIQAGFGDLLGKVTSLLDWKLAHYLYDEYFCDASYAIVAEPLRFCLENAKALRERDVASVRELFVGLINAGIAMAMVGNSRPCSGSEHHCSHYWDLLAYQGKRHHASHGLQVGYAVHWTARFYEALAALSSLDAPQPLEFPSDWVAYARAFYGDGADEVISAQASKQQWLVDRASRARFEDLPGMKQALQPEISFGDTAHRALEIMGIPGNAGFMEVSPSVLKMTFLHARELRARYTIFDFLLGQGLLDEVADRVIGLAR